MPVLRQRAAFILQIRCGASRGGLILSSSCDGNLRAGFAIYVGNGEGPEGNKLHAGDELGGERGQELPMPAEKESEQAACAEIENIVGGRRGALNHEGKDSELEYVGNDGRDHGDAQARTCGDFDGLGIEVSGRGHGSHQ